jgi:hypothetical protein
MSVTLRREQLNDAMALRAFLDQHFPRETSALRARVERATMMALCISIGDFQRFTVYSVWSSSAPVGVVTMASEPSRIVYQVGPVKAVKIPFSRMRIPGDPCVVLDESLDAQQRAEVLRLLAAALGNQPVRIQWASPNGVLQELSSVAEQRRTHFAEITDRFRPRYVIEHAGSFDQYLAGLGSSSRQTFRYSVRKLKRDMEDQVRLERYTEARQIEDFIRDAEEVSKNTYQWKELGLGFSNRAGIDRRLRAAAALGQFCGYILFLRDKPTAFIEGFRSSDLFIFYQIGFLPELSKLSVGTVAVLEVLRDLMDSPHPPRTYDFLPGEDSYKRRMSNQESEERSHYLFPRTLRWHVAALGLDASAALTTLGMKAKQRFGRKGLAEPAAEAPAAG